MTTIIERVWQAHAKLRAAKIEYRDTIENLCDEAHPFTGGEIVRVTEKAHNGKKMVVREVGLKHKHGPGWMWVARGPVLKGDGTESENRGEWCRKVTSTRGADE